MRWHYMQRLSAPVCPQTLHTRAEKAHRRNDFAGLDSLKLPFVQWIFAIADFRKSGDSTNGKPSRRIRPALSLMAPDFVMWSNREEERRHRPSCADSDSALSSGEFARAVVCRVLRQQLCTCKTPDSTSAFRSGSPSPPVGSYATPRACRSMIASTPYVGASSPDSLRLICRPSTRLDGLPMD